MNFHIDPMIDEHSLEKLNPEEWKQIVLQKLNEYYSAEQGGKSRKTRKSRNLK